MVHYKFTHIVSHSAGNLPPPSPHVLISLTADSIRLHEQFINNFIIGKKCFFISIHWRRTTQIMNCVRSCIFIEF